MMFYGQVLRLKKIIIIAAGAVLILLSGCGTVPGEAVSETAEVWYNLGNAYTELGRHDDAVKAFSRARDLNPNLFSAGYNLARVFIYQKKYDESLVLLDELLDADPENRIALETKAWVYNLKGDNESALKLYDVILEQSPVNRNSLYNSSVILSASGHYSEARERLRRFLEYYPEDESVFFDMAFLEAMLDEHSAALEWVDRHLEQHPEDVGALELKGDVLSVLKRYADSVTVYRDAFEASSKVGYDPGGGQNAKAVSGRISFKIAEILLVHIEDSESGLDALKTAVESGWTSKDDFERLLAVDADWHDAVAEILDSGSEQDGGEGPSGDADLVPESVSGAESTL